MLQFLLLHIIEIHAIVVAIIYFIYRNLSFCHNMQHFPFPAYSEMDTPLYTPKVNKTKGYMTLGHSNWIIWSPRNPFLQNEFPLY